MIVGRVTDDRAMVTIIVRGPSGAEAPVEAMLDTGFNGHLKLPASIISTLDLEFERDAVVMLADDSIATMPQFRGWILRQDTSDEILVLQSSGAALAGMALLRGYRVTLEVVDGGTVSAEPIPGAT